MKALIVAESETVLSAFSTLFHQKGCDVIKYRWLMKALDNLEEIEPQIIVISAIDYPRHWKTFVQFINSTFTNNIPKIFLYSADSMGENEIRKSKWLGVHSIINNLDKKEEFDQILELLPKEKHLLRLTPTAYKQAANTETKQNNTETIQNPSKIKTTLKDKPIISSKDEIEQEQTLKILFSNPYTGKMISGKVKHTTKNILCYVCDTAESIMKLKPGDKIDNCTIKKNGSISKITITILSITHLELKMEMQ